MGEGVSGWAHEGRRGAGLVRVCVRVAEVWVGKSVKTVIDAPRWHCCHPHAFDKLILGTAKQGPRFLRDFLVGVGVGVGVCV